jgi:glutathione S-transferase
MYKLYHQTICPFSRKIRALLNAKNIPLELVPENFWERRPEFIAMNTMGTIPILFNINDGDVVSCSSVIVEYIEEKHAQEGLSLIGNSLAKKAESRRIQYWFDHKFFNEVSKVLLDERYFNRFLARKPSPSSSNIMIAKHNLEIHLSYMDFLLSNRKYLVGNELTIADLAAAGHIATLDYFGDINWRNNNLVKDWYCLVKSHKGFQSILEDKIPGVVPPIWYNKLDF